MPDENRNSNNNSESILNLDPDILTPGMKQYLEVKKAHPDCVVMLRMGDFYEMFYADAVTAARELEITLTARGKGEKKAPLAGIPFHALEPYLGKLVKKGYKVAIVEQLEDPKTAKGLVKRGLVRIVTPGTIIESSMLNEKENNYIMALTSYGEELAVAFCDMSTGEFFTARVHNTNSLRNELGRLAPSECIIPESLLVNTELIEKIKNCNCYVNTIEDYYFRAEKAKETLLQHFNLHNLDAFGLEDQTLNISVSGALLYYLMNTQKNTLTHIKKISFRSSQDLMALDAGTIRNLELSKNIRDGSSRGTLLGVLDKTCTVMGARLLKKWLHEPLLKKKSIEKRADAVEELYHQVIVREEIKLILQEIYDIERLISRVNYGNANARDILSLRNSLSKIPLLKEKLAEFQSELLQDINATADFKELTLLLRNALRDDAPITLREGGIIKTGYNSELDQLHELKQNSRKYLQALEEQEQQKTGINSLKIGYTNVFGYFIEVTRKNIHLVPAHYIRKQTTANSERYITEELKLEEEKILGAEEKIAELEYTLFQEIVRQIITQTSDIQAAATRIAVLDVLSSLATVGMEQSYVRPELVEQAVIQIKNSRHPVIEKMESSFIANDLFLNPEEMMIITGPNMSGKCLIGESIIYTDRGMIPIKNFKPAGLNSEHFSPFKVKICGREGLGYTSHFYYDGERPTIKVITKFGYEIEGTANHPILVRTKEGKEIWRKLGEIQKDDSVIINKKIDLWGNEVRLNNILLGELAGYKYHYNTKTYRLPTFIDEELAYFMGLLVGDGTLTYKKCITLSNIDPEIISAFSRIVKDKFGYKVKTKKNRIDHFVSSKQIRYFLERIGMGYVNALKKEVPTSILQAPKNIVKAFLQGLFDTDGDTVKKYGNASVSTSSQKLAQQVQLILLNFGIISSLKPKKTYRNINYRVQIYGENAILFHQMIGFRLSRKSVRKEFASALRMPNYGIPHLEPLLKQMQRRIVSKKDKVIALKRTKNINSIFYTYIPASRNISHRKLKELIDYCEINEVFCQELREIYENNYFYDFIAEIKISHQEKEVYDFSVSKTHSFTANGFLNHNSTFMRQVALTVLMAQIGSFVPAEKAVLGITDRIFTRVGAYDDLSSGQSTFMVEMNETAFILNNATENSLIILDEIGRGTSTFDGVSIAWSVAEHIYNKIKAKTLFSTHYHVLNKLQEKFSRIRNYNLAVKEVKGDIIFLRKLIEGGTDQSYGIHVAKLAGLPFDVVERAREIQDILEKDDEMMRRIQAKKLQEQKGLHEF